MKNIQDYNDLILVSNIKSSNDEESLKELIRRHNPMCFSLYKKYSSALEVSGVNLQDLISSKDYIIYQSAKSFDPDKKSKFSTWLYNQIRYQCLNTINNNKNTMSMEVEKINFLIDQMSLKENNSSEKVKDANEYIFKILESCLDKRILQIYKMRYFNGSKLMAWSKIAKKLKVSTQTAINLHKKGMSLLKVKINSNFYLERV